MGVEGPDFTARIKFYGSETDANKRPTISLTQGTLHLSPAFYMVC